MVPIYCMLTCAAIAAQAENFAPSGRIELTPWAQPSGIAATLPWVEAGAPGAGDPFAALADLAPLAVLGATTAEGADVETTNAAGLRATVWMGMDAHALYLRVGVMDAHAFNVQSAGNIWDGDSIQISLDPVARMAPGLAVDADVLPRGALFATFANTTAGPRAWAHLRGGDKLAGPLNVPLQIKRDAALGQTLYNITLPFDELETTAGLNDRIGFAIQVNDANPNQASAGHLTWGGGSPGTFRPGRLHHLATALLPPDYMSLAATRTTLWQDGDYAEAVLVSRAAGSIEVEVQWRQQRHRLSLPAADLGSGAGAVRRWTLRLWGPPGCAHAQPLQLTVTDAKGRVREHLNTEVTCPARRMETVRNMLQSRLAAPKLHPLEKRMRQSQAALLETAWAKASTLLPESPEALAEVLQTAEVVARASLTHAAEWETYSHGKRPLTLTFVASQDGSLQPYGLRLPKHWTPEAPQPVVVFLHGKGDPRVSQFIADQETHTSTPLDDAYVLLPWGRGIMGYRGLAEADILEALAAAGTLFQFDTERTYLMGFSMGGAGAWSLALHAPEPWAAVAIASGGTWLTSLGQNLGSNALGLPIGVWHGDADGTVDVGEAYKMRAEMDRAHGDLQLHITRGGGHVFDDGMRHTLASWLLQHRRPPPGSFTYVADDFEHRGRRGMRLRRETAVAAFPQLSYHSAVDTVSIDTVGTTGLDVDLGPGGLNRQGSTSILWNGRLVYRGPPSVVVLGTGAGR